MNKKTLLAAMILLSACTTKKQTEPQPKQQSQEQTTEYTAPDLTTNKRPAKITVTGSRIKATGQNAFYASVGSYPLHQNRENYRHFEDHSIHSVLKKPISTFSIDVDTGAYANARRMLNQGQLPPKDAVRAEEFINYFDYHYGSPKNLKKPFATRFEITPSPWNKNNHLLQIGIKGFQPPSGKRPAANLVLLIDVSGSMDSPNKLGLLKKSLKLMSGQLTAEDRVSIVVYAGAAGVILEPTPGNQKSKITTALQRLNAGGSTNGGEGIELAYQLAEQAMIKDGINRILLATDGDFNVGISNFESLKELIEKKRKSRVSLTTLGFGEGNYNDHLMEQLADAGNGNYAYIDNIKEANKVLVEQINATLLTIAKDVKLQIEFNPQQVTEYRLIGYENRQLRDEDFANDQVDAGEIGAGHSVTAIYEITLKGNPGQLPKSRYTSTTKSDKKHHNELAFLKIRYKRPNADKSLLLQWPIKKSQIKPWPQSSSDFRFATAVAAFAQKLRGSRYLGDFDYEQILELAQNNRGKDPHGYRGELIQLISLSKNLK